MSSTWKTGGAAAATGVMVATSVKVKQKSACVNESEASLTKKSAMSEKVIL